MGSVRKCLGCSATYPPDEHACPKCGSHAADVEERPENQAVAKPEPKSARRRKT